MRTETLWQGERRAARTQWWHNVLDRPAPVGNWGEVMDEMAKLRFGLGEDREGRTTAVESRVSYSWNFRSQSPESDIRATQKKWRGSAPAGA